MLKTKAVELLNTFSNDELKEMSLFAESPYFNTNKNLSKLFELIKKDIKKINQGKLTEEDAYKKLFPGKQYNYGIMKNLVSGLAALADDFLTINSYKSMAINKTYSAIRLADQYDTRRLDKHYGKLIGKTTSELENQLIDNYYYSDRAMVEESKYFFFSSRNDYRGLEDAIYDEMIYTLCDFYRRFSRNLWKIHINIDNVNSRYEKDFIELAGKFIDFEKMTEELKGINEREYSYIRLNNYLIKLLIKPEDTAPYFELKKLLAETIDSYENYERFSILTKVLSYCSTAHRYKIQGFMRESLDMRILMMEKVKFNTAGLGPFNFHYFSETIMMFLFEKDTKGANEFLDKYDDSVGKINREINYNICKAYILEAEGKYKEALGFIAKARHSDTEINIRIRRLYFILYYNMNEFESGLDAVNAFRAYVKSNSDLTDILKQKYLNAIYFVEKVFKIKAMPEKYSASDIKDIIADHNERGWIMSQWINERLDELHSEVAKRK
ncbi:MAG: hypothetical protein IT280_05370 [Ignavibacteria bacterium]|nr:hypothetical protein [Ignavibacteria bacterium]